jgi:diguanylate cyclase (GGDEF)-like protein
MRLLETISKIAADAISKSQLHLATETYALTDPMTALPNARSLQMQFEKEVARADRTSASFQLLMLDLDGFKAVNDNFGHKAGDLMLKGIGKVILGQLRDYDFLARYAGDEFVALVPDTKVRDVSELCRRIEIAVKEFSLKVSDEASASVGISIGAASYPSEGVTFDEMIVAADKGMYATKSRHKSGEIAPDPGTIVRKVDHSFKPIPIDVNATETESEYLVELDETHIVSTAMN